MHNFNHQTIIIHLLCAFISIFNYNLVTIIDFWLLDTRMRHYVNRSNNYIRICLTYEWWFIDHIVASIEQIAYSPSLWQLCRTILIGNSIVLAKSLARVSPSKYVGVKGHFHKIDYGAFFRWKLEFFRTNYELRTIAIWSEFNNKKKPFYEHKDVRHQFRIATSDNGKIYTLIWMQAQTQTICQRLHE